MKTIYLTITFLLSTSVVLGQESRKTSYEKGETETYEIRSDKETKFIFRVGTPFNERAPMYDVPIKKYRLWPKKTLVNDKEYIKKYLLPYIKEELTPENGHLGISYLYELSTGKIKWITVFHENSITIPIKAIERFEKAMMKDDKAIFNRSTEGITDIDYFRSWPTYDLYELKHQTDESSEKDKL